MPDNKPLKIIETILLWFIILAAILFFAMILVAVWIGRFHNDTKIWITNAVVLVISLISYGVISDYNEKN